MRRLLRASRELIATFEFAVASGLALLWLLFHFIAFLGEQAEREHTPQSEFGTTPPDCGHLYNVGKHNEWFDCMGVGLK